MLKTESKSTIANLDICVEIPMSVRDVLNKIGDGLGISSVDLTLHLATGQAITVNPLMWDISDISSTDDC